MANYQYLEIGENHLHNHKYNKSEMVILDIENGWKRGFRIIHATPILQKNLAKVYIQIEYNVKNKTSSTWSDLAFFFNNITKEFSRVYFL